MKETNPIALRLGNCNFLWDQLSYINFYNTQYVDLIFFIKTNQFLYSYFKLIIFNFRLVIYNQHTFISFYTMHLTHLFYKIYKLTKFKDIINKKKSLFKDKLVQFNLRRRRKLYNVKKKQKYNIVTYNSYKILNNKVNNKIIIKKLNIKKSNIIAKRFKTSIKYRPTYSNKVNSKIIIKKPNIIAKRFKTSIKYRPTYNNKIIIKKLNISRFRYKLKKKFKSQRFINKLIFKFIKNKFYKNKFIKKFIITSKFINKFVINSRFKKYTINYKGKYKKRILRLYFFIKLIRIYNLARAYVYFRCLKCKYLLEQISNAISNKYVTNKNIVFLDDSLMFIERHKHLSFSIYKVYTSLYYLQRNYYFIDLVNIVGFNIYFKIHNLKSLLSYIELELHRTKKHRWFLTSLCKILTEFAKCQLFHSIKLLITGPIGKHGRTKTFKFQTHIIQLQTFKTPVYYNIGSCITKFGVLGIRLWVC